MEISSSPLFERSTRSFSLFIFYVFLAIILIAVDVRMSVLNTARENIKGFFLPILLSVRNVKNGLEKALLPHLNIAEIYKQNQELLQEKILLTKELEQLQNLDSENRQLRNLDGLKSRIMLNLITTEVVEFRPNTRRLLINKGSNDGVTLAQPVINEQGLIGQITKVFKNYSEVGLITSQGVMVPVKVMNSDKNDFYGTVVGNGSEFVEFQHYPQNYTIQSGDKLYTSGLANTFMSDYPVAEIIKVSAVSESAGVQVLAKPIVQFDNIKFVAIVINNQELGQFLEEKQILEKSEKRN